MTLEQLGISWNMMTLEQLGIHWNNDNNDNVCCRSVLSVSTMVVL